MSIKPREVMVKLRRAGFQVIRQTGSHVVLQRADGRETVLPMHAGDVPDGTLGAILRETGLSVPQFQNL